MVDVKRLLEYNEVVRHRYFKTLASLPWEELVKNREASFHSLRNIFIHTLNGINFWLDFLQNEKLYIRRKFDEYENIQDIQRYMEHVEERLKAYLTSITPKDYSKAYSITNNANKTRSLRVEDVLIHLFEEEIHHRGEVIALLWQMGVEPPAMGWRSL